MLSTLLVSHAASSSFTEACRCAAFSAAQGSWGAKWGSSHKRLAPYFFRPATGRTRPNPSCFGQLLFGDYGVLCPKKIRCARCAMAFWTSSATIAWHVLASVIATSGTISSATPFCALPPPRVLILNSRIRHPPTTPFRRSSERQDQTNRTSRPRPEDVHPPRGTPLALDFAVTSGPCDVRLADMKYGDFKRNRLSTERLRMEDGFSFAPIVVGTCGLLGHLSPKCCSNLAKPSVI